MSTTLAGPSTRRRLVRGAAVVLMLVVLVPVGALAVVALAPGLELGGRRAHLLVGFAPWWALAALAAGAVGLLLLRERRSATAAVLTLLAVLALATHVAVTVRLLDAGWSQGVAVSPFVPTDSREPADEPDDVIQYAESGGEPLEVYVWQPPPADRPAPVVVYVHGGGWTGGHPTDRVSQLRWFADRGWLVVAPEYPLSGPDRHLWDSTVPQIGCAMAWVSTHAAELGGDPSRLVLAGDSAGANLAINAAYESATGSLESSCGGQTPEVAAVVGLYPVVDPVSLHDLDGALAPEARRITEEYLGGSPADVPDHYRAVASATYISPDAPPTLLVVADADRLVPQDGAYRFADAASAEGVDVTVVAFPHLEHGFDVAPLPDALYREVAADWLASHSG